MLHRWNSPSSESDLKRTVVPSRERNANRGPVCWEVGRFGFWRVVRLGEDEAEARGRTIGEDATAQAHQTARSRRIKAENARPAEIQTRLSARDARDASAAHAPPSSPYSAAADAAAAAAALCTVKVRFNKQRPPSEESLLTVLSELDTASQLAGIIRILRWVFGSGVFICWCSGLSIEK